MRPAGRFLSGVKRWVDPARCLLSNGVKFLIGCSLLPVAFATSIVLYGQLGSIQNLSKNQFYFLLGIGTYLIVHLLFYQPFSIYIFGHELTHVLCTWICGGKVKSFRASSRGGRVTTTKSNFFINLAPYFFPIYTVILAFLYGGMSLFFDVSKYILQFIFLIAFSWTFHIVLTIHFIRMRQPDILKTGTLFSVVSIYIVNIAILAFILGLLFPEATFGDFLKSSYQQTAKIYTSIFARLSL